MIAGALSLRSHTIIVAGVRRAVPRRMKKRASLSAISMAEQDRAQGKEHRADPHDRGYLPF
jgi:hypothetical protein